MTDPPSEGAPAGETVGRYCNVRSFRQGAQGIVLLADDPASGRKVAIKVRSSASEADNRHADREAEVLAKLRSPAVIRLLDRVEYRGIPSLVVEFVEGVGLDRFVFERSLPVPERCRLFLGVCDAVASMHAEGVIHCDLNPSNVLITASGEVKVVDLGSAFAVDVPAHGNTGADHRGTPRYMSPEQERFEVLDERSDVYSLGAILYQLLCGCPPQARPGANEDPQALKLPSALVRDGYHAVVNGDPQKVYPEQIAQRRSTTTDALVATLTSGVEGIALVALHAEPAARYPSVCALGDAVAEWLALQATGGA